MRIFESIKRVKDKPEVGVETGISEVLNSAPLNDLMEFIEKIKKGGESREELLEQYEIMSKDSLVSSALSLIADDATQIDEMRKRIFWVSHKDPLIEKDLNKILDLMKVDEKAWSFAWNILVNGGAFLKTYYSESQESDKSILKDKVGFLFEIVNDYMSVSDLQMYGDTVGYYEFISNDENETSRILGVNDYIHFINDRGYNRDEITLSYTKDDKEVEETYKVRYGTSYLENVIDAYRIVDLLENIIIAVRFGRSSIYRLFEIEVGGSSKGETSRILREFKSKLSRANAFDMKSNQLYSSNKPVPYGQNIYIPVRNGKGEVKQQLVGGDYDVKSLLDIDYFRNKLFAALRVPKAFLGFEECLRGDTLVCVDDWFYPIKFLEEHKEYFIGKKAISCFGEGKYEEVNILDIVKTRKDATFVRVHLINELDKKPFFIDTTPDHLFMLKDGSYKEAHSLVEGESIMGYDIDVRVVLIEDLHFIEDAYDISVDSESHNFLIGGNIFVHNCNAGGIGNQSLTRIDIRYARTVKRLKKILCDGVTDMLNFYCRVKGHSDLIGTFTVETSKILSAEETDRQDDMVTNINLVESIRNLLKDVNDIDQDKLNEILLKDVLNMDDLYNALFKKDKGADLS